MAKGLGSKIEKITKATGIKTVVDKVSEITGKDCGCDKRKKTLDELYPSKGYLKPSEYEYIKEFFKTYKGDKLDSYEQRDMLLAIYNRTNLKNQKPTSCTSCLRGILENLRNKLKEYEEA